MRQHHKAGLDDIVMFALVVGTDIDVVSDGIAGACVSLQKGEGEGHSGTGHSKVFLEAVVADFKRHFAFVTAQITAAKHDMMSLSVGRNRIAYTLNINVALKKREVRFVFVHDAFSQQQSAKKQAIARAEHGHAQDGNKSQC